MSDSTRPLPVTFLGCLYIAVGATGFIFHLNSFLHSNEFVSDKAFHSDEIWIELTELLAIVAGAFLLRGKNWARWLTLGWMAFHVVISMLNAVSELIVHCLFFAAIAWFLFRPDAARYFRLSPAGREP